MVPSFRSLDIGELDGEVLVFGGPYSNLQATRKIREIANHRGIPATNVICTGDLVAYCANPEETVSLIQAWGCHVVMGNCEESLGNLSKDCGCGFEPGSTCDTLSRDWYTYAQSRISSNIASWMRQLPHRIMFHTLGRRFAALHGGVENISEFVFPSSPDQSKTDGINTLDVDCIIGGHCGIPFGQRLGNLEWLNAGVIGMPANDGTADTWYMILTVEHDTLRASWHRLVYDYRGAATAMDVAGLQQSYKDTLSTGLWPSLSVLPESERCETGIELALAPLALGH